MHWRCHRLRGADQLRTAGFDLDVGLPRWFDPRAVVHGRGDRDQRPPAWSAQAKAARSGLPHLLPDLRPSRNRAGSVALVGALRDAFGLAARAAVRGEHGGSVLSATAPARTGAGRPETRPARSD